MPQLVLLSPPHGKQTRHSTRPNAQGTREKEVWRGGVWRGVWCVEGVAWRGVWCVEGRVGVEGCVVSMEGVWMWRGVVSVEGCGGGVEGCVEGVWVWRVGCAEGVWKDGVCGGGVEG